MSDQSAYEVLERGKHALALLSGPDMQMFIAEQKALLMECIVNTEPHEAKKRDSLYYQHKGFTEFLGTLQSYADAAVAIVTKDANEAEANIDLDMDSD